MRMMDVTFLTIGGDYVIIKSIYKGLRSPKNILCGEEATIHDTLQEEKN